MTVIKYCVVVCFAVLQCVAVCCSLLQCVALCCSVLQCVAVCCTVSHCVALCCSPSVSAPEHRHDLEAMQCVAMCCNVLQCGAVREYVSAVCCSVLRVSLATWPSWVSENQLLELNVLLQDVYTLIHCNTLHHVATHCITLQHNTIQTQPRSRVVVGVLLLSINGIY